MRHQYITCYIISEQDFGIKCAQLLVDQGYEIQGIITSNPNFTNWASSCHIPHFQSIDNLLSINYAAMVDYLFCIQTEHSAPKQITNLIRNQVIRYLNIFLEEYSNIQAIPWSILNNKIELGLGWYTQDGFIIEEAAVYLNRQETTRSLTLKCQQRALKLFKRVVQKTLVNKITFKNMAPIQFNNIPLYKRPANNGVISWDQPAEEIDRLYRALSFGNNINDFCSPKLYLNSAIFIINKLALLKTASKKSPGTILDISDKYIRVSTATKDIAIYKLADLHSHPLSIKKFSEIYKLHEGYILDKITIKHPEKTTATLEAIAKNEPFWVRTFIQQPESESQLIPNHNLSSRQIKLVHASLPPGLSKKLTKLFNLYTNNKEIVFSALLIYIHRLNNYNNFSLNYASKHTLKLKNDEDALISKFVPFNMLWPIEKLNFSEVLHKVISQNNLLNKAGTFFKDIFTRYPQLQECSSSQAISVIFDHEMNVLPELTNTHLSFVLKENSFDIYVNQNNTADINFINSVKNIPAHIKALLDSVCKAPKLSVNNLEILTSHEKNLMLYDWNKTNTSFPSKTIHKLFEEQAHKTPNHLAIQLFDKKLRYEKLNQKANQLARYLKKLGVKPETLVGLYFDHCPDAVIGALAILKAGGAYVPISHDINKKRLQNIIDDTHLKIVITNLNDCLADFNGTVVHTVKHRKRILNENTTNLPEVCSPNNLAYVIFTSGTTGKPKGVLIEHMGVVNLAMAQIKHFQVSPNSRILGLAAYTFDASVAEWYDALLSGAALILVPRKHLLPGKPLLDILNQFKISVATIPPSLLNATRPNQLPYLKTVVSAIEPCNQKIIKQWSKNRIFIDAYGPTENSVCTTMSDYLSANSPPTIGKPIANVKVYVLNKLLKTLPVGIVGELFIEGIGLSRGYLNRPEITQEKFVSNPFSKIPNAKFYKSGDLVKWNFSGNLEFHGRVDEQIKIRGHRIETDEIEHQLSQHESIEQCVTTVSKGALHDNLIAYVTLTAPSKTISKQALLSFLKQTLPEYMLPNKFIILNKIPLTQNQKTDKSKLNIKLGKEITDSQINSSVLTETAEQIRKIWTKLLKVKKIGPNENFFDLGGHSLLITKLISQVQKQFKKNISIQQFLKNPTIDTMVTMINPKIKHTPIPFNSSANTLLLSHIPKLKKLRRAIQTTPKAVLITGATGFLGSHLFLDIFRKSKADIFLLVRATDMTHAKSKLENSFNTYLLDHSILTSKRVHIIIGDFSKKLLGMSQYQFESLSKKIDTIYHSGAHVHHLYNLETLKNANVQSVVELIKFSTTNKLKTINYISTFSTVSDQTTPEECFITWDLKGKESINGYIESKKISEKLLSIAHSQNIPVNIYRPAWISGHSEKGSWAFENNHLLRLIKGCIQMGVAPNWPTEINLLPVDILSNLIVQSSLNLSKSGKVFNSINSNSIKWNTLVSWIDKNHCPLKLVPPHVWYKHLKAIDSDNALFPLLSLYLSSNSTHTLESIPAPHQLNKNTTTALNNIKIDFPKIDHQLLSVYFKFLRDSDFL